MKTLFQDKPANFPQRCADGKAVRPLTQVLLDRRATSHFKPDAVPDEYLKAILEFGAQAPSGYNLQPWRFIVVRKKENRERLQKAAFNQEKVTEAPVVVIAFAIRDDWKNYIDAVFQEGVRRGVGKPEMISQIKKQAADFLEKKIDRSIWINRHTMIAFTTMMLVAETYGLDTAPMEGFDPQAVKREFGLPDNAEVVGLLAIGFAKEPDKAYGGRFALSEIVHEEQFGQSWNGATCADQPGGETIETIEKRASEPLPTGAK
jgi:nitroreductase